MAVTTADRVTSLRRGGPKSVWKAKKPRRGSRIWTSGSSSAARVRRSSARRSYGIAGDAAGRCFLRGEGSSASPKAHSF